VGEESGTVDGEIGSLLVGVESCAWGFDSGDLFSSGAVGAASVAYREDARPPVAAPLPL
jgi:hypothetical protein